MKVITYILAIFCCFALFSCKKAKENKLIGEWRLLPQTAADRNDTIIFQI